LDKLDVINNDEEWGNDDDSGWDDEEDIEEEIKINQKLKLDLVWKDDNLLERTKRGPYMKGKIPKSTYYDKFGPNGVFTKAAADNKKITSFFKNNNEVQEGILSDLEDEVHQVNKTNIEEEFSSDSEDEVCPISEKIQSLKDELEKQHCKMTIVEYNWKRAIYEYLTLSNNNNGRRKIRDSLEVAKKVFIDGGPWRARRIRYITNFWLNNNKLLISRQGKHQKTHRLIDDEDIADMCKGWFREQNYNATPSKFKSFIQEELLPKIGVSKRKNISLMTATRWLNILGYSFQQHHKGIYYDGHEREDVVQYRKEFLEKMFEYEKYMSKFDGEFMDRIQYTLSITTLSITTLAL
jgi:hypothetical protein